MMRMLRSPNRRTQRGVVLITAVLIVAIIAGVAASLGLGQQVWLRQTENLIERAQADSLRRSALDWVAILLRRDANDNKFDHLNEPWAKQLPPLPTEGGMIR
jgi:general secretion pathway protein K